MGSNQVKTEYFNCKICDKLCERYLKSTRKSVKPFEQKIYPLNSKYCSKTCFRVFEKIYKEGYSKGRKCKLRIVNSGQ